MSQTQKKLQFNLSDSQYFQTDSRHISGYISLESENKKK